MGVFQNIESCDSFCTFVYSYNVNRKFTPMRKDLSNLSINLYISEYLKSFL